MLAKILVILGAIIIIYIFYTIYDFIQKYIARTKWVKKLPGPQDTNWFLGNCSALTTTPEIGFKMVRMYSLKYYPIYRLSASLFHGTCIINPEDFELVLANSKHISKSLVYFPLKNWLGTGLLTSNGKKWFERRKILTPTFHFNILRQFITIFNEESEAVIDQLKQKCDKPYLEVNPIITELTLKTITETAMGLKLELKNETHTEYKAAVMEMTELIVSIILKPHLIVTKFFTSMFHREQKCLKILHNFTRNVITERRKNFKRFKIADAIEEEEVVYSSKKRLAMLDLLLSAQEEDGSIDDEGIREEVDTFTFEGHDTTSVALSYILMLLACHQDVQDKILDEMKEVLGDPKKKPSLNELNDLKYMERCIKESLRLYPSVPQISRELGDDIITHSAYKLLKGSIVHFFIYDLHHNPNVWPDPEKFDPDRFLPENIRNRHPFAFLPFSAGARNCIGQRFAILELKSVVCAILAYFRLDPIDTPSTIELVFDLVLRTKNNIKIKFIPRNREN